MPVADLLSPLNHVLFVLGSDRVSVSELMGFVTGAGAVWLAVHARIANFPVGLANTLLFLVLFVHARLYADAALQVVYLGLGAAGWWAWLRPGPSRSRLATSRASPSLLLGCAVAAALFTVALVPILRGAHDVAPFLDAVTSALSLVAQTLLNLKKVENWWVWIAADVIYVPLYLSKGLFLTGLVYVVFLWLCVLGSRAWRLAPRRAAPLIGAAGA